MIQTNIDANKLAELVKRASSFEHTVMVMNTPNKNGRIYPTDIVLAALAKIQYPLFGCFMDDLQYGNIPLDKITHEVLGIRIDGDNVIARIVILKALPHGMILQHLTDQLGEQDYRTAGQCLVDPHTGLVSGFSIISIGALLRGQGA